MHCPKCGKDSRVTETRIVAGNNRRRRTCTSATCTHRFTTIETIVESATRHDNCIVMILPTATVYEMRAALALLERGLAGDLSQNLRSDERSTDPEEAETAHDEPLAIGPGPRIEET